MDYEIYDSTQDSQTLINNRPVTNKTWSILSDSDMDNNDDYFSWTNDLKIDGEKFTRNDNSSNTKVPRKRKLSTNSNEIAKLKAGFKNIKNSLESAEDVEKQNQTRRDALQNGTSRMPQWQVDDITDINADIEGSFTSLGADLSNGAYNMSDAILAIPGLQVFKQEAPSPTSHDVGSLQIARQNHSNSCPQVPLNNALNDGNANANILTSNSLQQLLGSTNYSNLQNSVDTTLLVTATSLSQDGYSAVTSSNSHFPEDCRFQYVLAAATSIATKINEDTLTYLNQGQSYEIKLKKLGDLSTYRGKMLKTIIRICFHERRLQYMEKEQMSLWQRSRPGDRILEVDIPLSYGLIEVIQPSKASNIVHFNWDPTKEVGVYIKVNCISTEFTPKKHGGEKGVPFRIQVETYQGGETFDASKRLHAAACQIKVFKLKGADRKHKQDREKILKRPVSEQEKFQPSYECTVLNDIPFDAVVSNPVVSTPAVSNPPYSPESGNANRNNQIQTDATIVSPPVLPSPNTASEVSEPVVETNNTLTDYLPAGATPQQTSQWLTANRFEKYLDTFSSFAAADMLRMSKEDFVQICGQADGIRLYNALHLKTIAPKLTIYVCRENTTIFNAIFLSAHNNVELMQKLASVIGVPQEQIRDIYIQGPRSIHIHINNDVIRHIKEETIFSLEIIQDNGSYILLLKPTVK